MADQVVRPRFLSDQIAAALDDTPVVAVDGARQVGKSTLVEQIASDRPGSHIVTLDDETQLEAARADPRAFVDHHGLLVIDEIQRAPELLRAIKASVDRDRRPGRFLITGSTRLLWVPEMSESLAGRVEITTLWPFSQGEINGTVDRFVDAVFGAEHPNVIGTLERVDYARLICAGGFPEPRERSGRRRSAWFDSYSTTVLERMVADIADVERRGALPRLLRLSVARTSQELNVADVASDAGLPYRTVGTYLGHLQAVFLVSLLPAWSRNLTSKVARRPKITLADTGLAADLLDVDATGIDDPTGVVGPLLESFVAMELRKQLGWSEVHADLYHFRDRGGPEVDLVLERRDGRVVGIEVKASTTVRNDDFKGLRLLEERLGDQFVRGVVLYRGPETVALGERLRALPVQALWTAMP